MGFDLGKLNPIAAAADAVINPIMQWRTNVANRKFTREMYGRQRADALSDWNMQNQYNSPEAQMERFKAAGLNPNLIYGQSSDAPSVRSSSSSGGQAEAPQVNAAGAVMAANQIALQKNQVDLTAQQVLTEIERQRNLRAQSIAAVSSAGLSDARANEVLFDLGLKTELKDTTIEGRKLANQNVSSQIAYRVNEDARRTITTMTNVAEASERIATLQKGREKTDADINRIKQEIELMKKDGTLKDFDIKWRESGQNPSDPAVLKVWDGIMRRLGFTGDVGVMQEFKDLPKMFTPKEKPWYRQNPTKYRATDSN